MLRLYMKELAADSSELEMRVIRKRQETLTGHEIILDLPGYWRTGNKASFIINKHNKRPLNTGVAVHN